MTHKPPLVHGLNPGPVEVNENLYNGLSRHGIHSPPNSDALKLLRTACGFSLKHRLAGTRGAW